MSERDDETCPDGGWCHHECDTSSCFRVVHAEPLSGVYKGDEWPLRVRLALGRSEPDARIDYGPQFDEADDQPVVQQPTMPVRLACCHEWRASRVEVETAPVRHVCNARKGHKGEHVCSCGAFVV